MALRTERGGAGMDVDRSGLKEVMEYTKRVLCVGELKMKRRRLWVVAIHQYPST